MISLQGCNHRSGWSSETRPTRPVQLVRFHRTNQTTCLTGWQPHQPDRWLLHAQPVGPVDTKFQLDRFISGSYCPALCILCSSVQNVDVPGDIDCYGAGLHLEKFPSGGKNRVNAPPPLNEVVWRIYNFTGMFMVLSKMKFTIFK